ncbi:DUF3306 domain-containing protein [Massilia sp. Mn16-1_5]|uniref:DUF3306 domain-containing protein n=1 Tax=Massilia sp. Mn16-1_5 TaxID=2079199 RepID=UPI00109E7C41|nr:DUF3306 domain-containing protein [Massilia sp. Mn16-1_5]THC39120.1 DUF3306 domain-containing protein [Massilia sp. Mn16-1_5]
MPEEGFLRRWARKKADSGASGAETVAEAPPAPAPTPAAPAVPLAEPAAPAAAERPTPTLEDASKLTHDSDFSAFVSQAVDKDVRRLALKKLFSDPHFNVLDRLDMYMDDYNKPDPVSATMLAALDHARGVLRRPEEVQAELQRLALGTTPAGTPEPIAEAEAQEAAMPEQGAAVTAEAADPDKLVQFQPAAEARGSAHVDAATPIAHLSEDAHNGETQQ